ncbi:hypothetical protein [Streptacidiphilus cavernicola]|uniref:Uncharacterized protein n=1 Tax=Streptacidiphilus cavernicola TaxID=3342716 RepID=A0ABV6VP87_9ACTN
MFEVLAAVAVAWFAVALVLGAAMSVLIRARSQRTPVTAQALAVAAVAALAWPLLLAWHLRQDGGSQ